MQVRRGRRADTPSNRIGLPACRARVIGALLEGPP